MKEHRNRVRGKDDGKREDAHAHILHTHKQKEEFKSLNSFDPLMSWLHSHLCVCVCVIEGEAEVLSV